jgi:hypothetical protein
VPPKRPSLPAALERDVLVEAGHRCAIPTCHEFPVQIHHIKDRSKGGKDEFSNLIGLCATCHDRVTRGYIKQRDVRQYKANLAVINSRYSDLERRVLQIFAENPEVDYVVLPTGMELLMSFLVGDEMVEMRVPANEVNVERFPTFREYWLTEHGEQLVERWAEAQPLDG